MKSVMPMSMTLSRSERLTHILDQKRNESMPHVSVTNLAEAVWVESEQLNAVLLLDASTW
jgi:hypothetical protein